VTSLPAYREELGLRAAALRPGCVWSKKPTAGRIPAK